MKPKPAEDNLYSMDLDAVCLHLETEFPELFGSRESQITAAELDEEDLERPQKSGLTRLPSS